MVGSEPHHHHHQQHHQNHQQQQQQQRSKEALGMVALHEALRTVCLNTDWTYSVFWSIRPRPRVRGGGNSCKVGDDNGSLMLMWEDGYCRGRGGSGDCYGEIEGEDPVRKSFSKMSIQLYNYGEGLMGKVASDKCHKWVFKEQTESESNASSYWQSSFDAIPSEWNDQFESGIQTIAVIQAGHGLLQLGSCKIIPEDLHFVLRMRHTFESLGYQSGFYLSQLFSSNRSPSSSNTSLMGSNHPILPPQTQQLQPSQLPLYNWSGSSQRPMMAQSSLPAYQPHMPFPVMPHANKEPDSDMKWPTGLSFFNALTNNVNAKLLFDSEGLGDKPEHQSHQDQSQEQSNAESHANPSEFLSLDSHTPTYNRAMQGYYLNRVAQTLRLVEPPVLWIVVEGNAASFETSEILRKTGVMYRHLVCKRNMTSIKDRGVHQRNTALEHIELHKLDGIVYFADDDNVYSLELFESLREIRRFGTWPVAMLAPSKNKAILEGPVCNGSQVIGWHTNEKSKRLRRFHVDMSGFAFNSTILWDPKRWKRPFPHPTRQLDTVKEGFQETTFIEQVVADESDMEGVPPACSRILNWHLHLDALDVPYPQGWVMQKNLEAVITVR